MEKQRRIQLTIPLSTSAGMGLSAADLAGICTRSSIANGKNSRHLARLAVDCMLASHACITGL
jgi:hypothetical protein